MQAEGRPQHLPARSMREHGRLVLLRVRQRLHTLARSKALFRLPELASVSSNAEPVIAELMRSSILDARQGKCYTSLNEAKKCVENLPIRLSKIDCCCGKNMGRAWGDECEPCPMSKSGWFVDWPNITCASVGEIFHNCHANIDSPDEFKMLCVHESAGGTNGTSIMPVDECVLRPGICGGGKCVDTPDSFTCDCYPGYHIQKSGDVQVCEG